MSANPPRESDCYDCEIKEWCQQPIYKGSYYTNDIGIKKDYAWNDDGKIYIKNCEAKAEHTEKGK